MTTTKALTPTEIVTQLAQINDWRLHGDGDHVSIEKSYVFKNYYETIAFVNAVAYIAHNMDHHPHLSVHYNRCDVQLSTHDVRGLSTKDFACATQYDALYNHRTL